MFVRIFTRDQTIGKIVVKMGSGSNVLGHLCFGNGIAAPLSSMLPWEVLRTGGQQQLLQLTSLNLLDNRLTGPIPTELFGFLTNLSTLYINMNQLTGSIPNQLGLLSNLENLLLNNNQLDGSIRDSFDTFSSLEFIDLAQNSFTGTLRK